MRLDHYLEMKHNIQINFPSIGCRKIFLYLMKMILLFPFAQNSYSQNESLRFEHIGIEEGLSNENVTQIFQDSKGYLWFGTFDGLYNYDAYSFTKYQFDPFDSNSLSQNFIYTIFEDKHGIIWVSTFEGLCKFDRYTEKFTRYKPSPEAKFFNPNIIAINEDTNGILWVGSTSGELARFDKQTGRFLEDSFDFDFKKLQSGIDVIYKDNAGQLWIGNRTGLHLLKLTHAKAGQQSHISITSYQNDPRNPNSLSGNSVRSIMEDRSGVMWVATNNGLNSFDKKTGLFKRYQHEPGNIHSISSNNLVVWFGNGIREDYDGNLWIATDKGLNKLDRNRNIFTSYSHDPNEPYSLSSDKIYCLLIDNAGILWAASWGAKLNKTNLNGKAFGLKQFNPNNRNSLSNNKVTTILEDSAGIIWIGTEKGLNRWNKSTDQFTHFRHSSASSKTLRHDTIMAMLEDRHGHFWICNGDVLSQINKQTFELTHHLVPAANLIFSISEDQQGLLWLGTGNGIRSFDERTNEFDNDFRYDSKNTHGISDGTAQTIFADSKDNIWIGYGSRGTDRYSKKTKRFSHYKHNPHDSASISSNIVFSFCEDSKGTLWLGSWAGGLSYFDYKKESFKTLTDKHGLASTTVFSIVEDNNDHLWLGTRNGLSQFDPVTKTFTNYDYKDGLQGNIFAAGYRERGAHFKGRDGTLYFGGSNGFNFFNPLRIKPNGQITPVVITQFKLFDSLIKGANEKKEIVLDYNQNYFSFQFSSLSYYNPAKNKYAYKLEGVDKDWVYSGSRRYVAYTNIDPGTYVFKVKATNNDGVWNKAGTSVSVVVKPPWWRTWWAYTFFALLIGGLIYTLFRYRVNKIRMQHEIALQQHKASALEMQALRAQMNPHFIFNSLNSINLFILENNKLQASEYLSKFSRLIRLILQNSREALIPLESELEALQLYLELESLRFENKFEYKIVADDDVDATVLKVPPLIIQPYAENAIWHGLIHMRTGDSGKNEKGQLAIALFLEEEILCCKITDNGIGRKKAAELKSKSVFINKSMGMKITKNRLAILEKINGNDLPVEIKDLTYSDGSAAGTEVLLKIPLL